MANTSLPEGGPPALGSLELFQALLAASERGDLPLVQARTEEFLLNESNFVKCVDHEGNTILHQSIQKDTSVLQHILAKIPTANVNQPNSFGKTPLHLAVKKNLPSAVKLLLAAKADPHSFNSVGSNALHTAAACGSVECVELFLGEVKMDVNAKDPLGNTALHKCSYDGRVRVAELFLAHGAQLNALNAQQQTPLHVATKANQVELVRYLIEKKANVNATDNLGLTPLHYSSSRCFHDLAQLLVEKGADLNAADQHGNTPLHAAAKKLQAGQ